MARDSDILSDRKTCDLLYKALYAVAESLDPRQKPFDPKWVLDIAYDIAKDALKKRPQTRIHVIAN